MHDCASGPGEGCTSWDCAGIDRFFGVLPDANGASQVTGVCGDSIDVSLKVEKDSISDIRALPHGCGYTRICASMMCRAALGKPLDEASQMEPEMIMERLKGLPEDHLHCVNLALDSLCAAIEDYYRRAKAAG